MSNYPTGFTTQEQSRYFGRSTDSYREREEARARREALADRAHYANRFDKETDQDVIKWRANRAEELKALRRGKRGTATS